MIAQAYEGRREFELGGIVPWGRRLWEYRAFFGLGDPKDIGPILDVGGGPASFAAEATREGAVVVAADPIYALPASDIACRFDETAEAMRIGMTRAAYRFNWKQYGSEASVHRLRREALELFLNDFEAGRVAGRYVPASLPSLPFEAKSFRLALVSHLLFLYGDDLDFAFHLAALHELLRVADEVRVFPLFNLDGLPSSHLPGVMNEMKRDGVEAELVRVPFEFQKGATRMLRLSRG
jgi:SAM-dependent methyltransferase